MAIKSIVKLSSSLFLGVDTTEDREVIVTCGKSLKDEGEAILSHFGIYLEVIFGSVVLAAFTQAYRLTMEEFQYCPLKKCAIERIAAPGALVTSSIATDDSNAGIDQCFANWGLDQDFEEVSNEIGFDRIH